MRCRAIDEADVLPAVRNEARAALAFAVADIGLTRPRELHWWRRLRPGEEVPPGVRPFEIADGVIGYVANWAHRVIWIDADVPIQEVFPIVCHESRHSWQAEFGPPRDEPERAQREADAVGYAVRAVARATARLQWRAATAYAQRAATAHADRELRLELRRIEIEERREQYAKGTATEQGGTDGIGHREDESGSRGGSRGGSRDTHGVESYR